MYWIALVLATLAFAFASTARADVSSPRDTISLRQLQTLALAPGYERLPQEFEALTKVVRRPNAAASLATLLSGRKELRAFEPEGWLAISPELCGAAGLDRSRCVSVTCLIPQLNPTEAGQCPTSPSPRPGGLPPPPDPSKLGEWLENVGKAVTSPIKPTLLKRELPIDVDVITAKGILHALWPDLTAAASRINGLAPGNVEPLLREVLQRAAERSSRAARIVAAARAIRLLPEPARAVIEPNASRFLERASKLEALYKDPAEATILLASSVRELEGDLDAATGDLSSLAAVLNRRLPEPAAYVPLGKPGECPSSDGDDVYELAATDVAGRKLGLALRRGSELAAKERELTVVLTAREPTKITIKNRQVDGTEASAEIKVAPQCLRTVIPLGIVVSGIELREGRLIHTGPAESLVQREIAGRFQKGVDELLTQVGSGLPATVLVSRPRLAFSPDFSNGALIADVTLPMLGATVSTRVSLLEAGKLVLKPSATGLIGLSTVVERAKSSLVGRTINIGPLKAKVTSFDQASPELVKSGTWFELRTKIHLVELDLGEVKTLVVDRGGLPRLELAADLTTLIRAPLASLAKRINTLRDVIAKVLPDPPGELSDEMVNALLIERAGIAANGRALDVTLALDLALLTGKTGLPRVTAKGELGPDAGADLGLGKLYGDLIGNALKEAANLRKLVVDRLNERLGREVEQTAFAAVDDAVRALGRVTYQAFGIDLSFKRAQVAGEGTLTATWDDMNASLGKVRVVIGSPPRIEFLDRQINDADRTRLGKKLESATLGRVKGLIGLDWKSCGEPRVASSRGGIIVEVSVEAPYLGCLPLPAVVFNAAGITLDGQRTIGVIRPVVEEKVTLLVPVELRKHIMHVRWDPSVPEQVSLDVKARPPGVGVDLRGTIAVNIKTGAVKVNTDPTGVIFDEILKQFTGLAGNGFKVEPVPDRLALRASGVVDLGVVAMEIQEMELTPERVYLPEVGARLPAAVAIGPFTVFPIQLTAKLQKPTRVGIVGDASLAGASQVVRIRSRIGFDLPNPKLNLSGTMTAVEVLDLFELNGQIDLAKKLLKANARTTGILSAIMPSEQALIIDPRRAELDTSISLLLLAVKGHGEIKFADEPSIILDGRADLAGLAALKAGLSTDLRLRHPTATVEGGVDLQPIGKIGFDAKASLQSVRLSASIIGIHASLVLPSFGDLNGGIIRKLFEALLKPSIDLKSLSLKNITISLAPRIGGGEPGSPGSQGGENGGRGGGTGQGQSDRPGPSVLTPSGWIRSGTIPSEWQYGWIPSPDPGMYCEARWRSKTEIEWLGNVRAPAAVVRMTEPPGKPFLYLGSVETKVTYWRDCSNVVGSASVTDATMIFDGTEEPKIWHEGTSHLESARWIDQALKRLGEPGAAAVTRGRLPSAHARSILRVLADEKLTGDVENALRTIKLSDGRTYYRVAAPSGAGRIHLVEAGSSWGAVRSFVAATPLGKLIWEVTAGPPAPLASLRDGILPLVFDGREPRLLSDANGRVLVEVTPFFGHAPFVAAFGTTAPRCGARVELEQASTATRENSIYDPIASALLAESSTCASSARWTKLFTVLDAAGSLVRVVGLHEGGPKDWAVEFVDIEGKCLRSKLSGQDLINLVDRWGRDGRPDADLFRSSLGTDNGLSLALEALRRPDLHWAPPWSGTSPFLLAKCEASP